MGDRYYSVKQWDQFGKSLIASHIDVPFFKGALEEDLSSIAGMEETGLEPYEHQQEELKNEEHDA